MLLESKSHKVTKKGDIYTLTFKDGSDNTLKLKCEGSDFNNYEVGDHLGWKLVQQQLEG